MPALHFVWHMHHLVLGLAFRTYYDPFGHEVLQEFLSCCRPCKYRVCNTIETFDWAFNQNGNVSIQFSIAKCHILNLVLLVLMQFSIASSKFSTANLQLELPVLNFGFASAKCSIASTKCSIASTECSIYCQYDFWRGIELVKLLTKKCILT